MPRPTFNETHLARLFIVGLVLAGAYSAWTETPPEALCVVPCPVRVVSGIDCPGCGMTRSCVAMARGDVLSAWNYHPLSFSLVALAAGFATFPDRLRRSWRWLPRWTRATLFTCLLVLVLGVWVARLTGG